MDNARTWHYLHFEGTHLGAVPRDMCRSIGVYVAPILHCDFSKLRLRYNKFFNGSNQQPMVMPDNSYVHYAVGYCIVVTHTHVYVVDRDHRSISCQYAQSAPADPAERPPVYIISGADHFILFHKPKCTTYSFRLEILREVDLQSDSVSQVHHIGNKFVDLLSNCSVPEYFSNPRAITKYYMYQQSLHGWHQIRVYEKVPGSTYTQMCFVCTGNYSKLCEVGHDIIGDVSLRRRKQAQFGDIDLVCLRTGGILASFNLGQPFAEINGQCSFNMHYNCLIVSGLAGVIEIY